MRSTSIAAAAALIAFSAAAEAQILRGGRPDSTRVISSGNDTTRRSDFERRSSLAFSFTQTRPIGELRRNIGFGYGGSINYVYRLDSAGVAGLRFGGSYGAYGREEFRVPLSYTIGGRVQVDVTTTNSLATLTLGPQLMFPVGIIRPFAHAGGGVILFNTNSSVRGVDDYENEFNTRNHSDGTLTWTAGGGVFIPIHRGRSQILMTLGADYFYGGDATYLRRGSIRDLPDGSIRIDSFHSETSFFNVSLGIRITP